MGRVETQPAKRTMAPAFELLTFATTEVMLSSECVSDTDTPSASRCSGSLGGIVE